MLKFQAKRSSKHDVLLLTEDISDGITENMAKEIAKEIAKHLTRT